MGAPASPTARAARGHSSSLPRASAPRVVVGKKQDEAGEARSGDPEPALQPSVHAQAPQVHERRPPDHHYAEDDHARPRLHRHPGPHDDFRSREIAGNDEQRPYTHVRCDPRGDGHPQRLTDDERSQAHHRRDRSGDQSALDVVVAAALGEGRRHHRVHDRLCAAVTTSSDDDRPEEIGLGVEGPHYQQRHRHTMATFIAIML